MVKWCVVPNCKSGSRVESKRSMFRVPKDKAMWKKWEVAIPGIVKLFQTDVVCEKHFDEKDISREWEVLDENRKLIARATYKRPKLQELAVPSRFGDSALGKDNCVLFHEYAKRIPISHFDPANDNGSQFSTNSLSTVVDNTRVDSPSLDNGMPSPPMDVSSCEPVIADSLSDDEILEVPSSPEIVVEKTEFIISETLDENKCSTAEFAAYVPESWSIGKSRTENAKYTYFSYAISKMVNNDPCPVIQKCVTLDAIGTLKYFVYGRRVEMPEKELERVLEKKEMLSNILQRFEVMRVCSGLGEIAIDLVRPGETYHDWMEKLRTKDCSLISKQKRCEPCVKSRECIEQRVAR